MDAENNKKLLKLMKEIGQALSEIEEVVEEATKEKEPKILKETTRKKQLLKANEGVGDG